MKRGARISYDIVRLNASAAELIAEEISGQKAPTFKIRKVDKAEGGSTRKKKRQGEEFFSFSSETRGRKRRNIREK